MKYQNVARIQSYSPFVVGHVFENAQWKSSQFDFAAAIVLVKQRLRLAGVCDAQFLPAFLPRREAGGHEPPFDASFAHELVHLLEHFGWLQLLRRQAAHDSDRHRSVQRGSRSLSAYIAKRDADLLRPIAQK